MRPLIVLALLTSTAAAAPRAIKVAASEGRVCALLDDGTVRCWGDSFADDGEHHTPVAIAGVAKATDLAVSLSSACVRHADKTATCWGDTSFLEMDNKSTAAHAVPILAKADSLAFAGTGDSCAKYADGTHRCWGSGAAFVAVGMPGQYGSSPLPVIPALAKATQISVGESLGCARMADATVMCWGKNEYGQVGDGTTQMQLKPVPVRSVSDVDQVVVGRESACALISGGTVRCWGGNDAGQLGDGTTTSHKNAVDVKGVRHATALVATELDVCAIVEHGRLTCWGFNRHGQLGNGVHGQESSGPVAVSGLEDVRSVALAFSHACAVVGTGDVYCWGQGWRGVIGDGLQADRDLPTKVKWTVEAPKTTPLPAGIKVVSVAVSMVHTCAALSDGSVRCWGRNDGGIVNASGNEGSFERPVAVPGVAKAVAVAVGMFDSYARLADGNVVTWGRKERPHVLSKAPVTSFVNGDGSACWLRGDAATCHVFAADNSIQLAGVTQVVASGLFACAVMKDGTARCAGTNNHGQLGDGTTTDRSDFVAVKGLPATVVQLAIGDFQACARLADNTVRCWGDIAMTGMGDAIQTAPSVIAGLRDVVDIAAGPATVCARMKSGKVSCWGQIRPVQLGRDRDDWHSDKPRDVPWLANTKQLALGQSHSCAITQADGVACWGENEAGQLGDATMDARPDAVPVRW